MFSAIPEKEKELWSGLMQSQLVLTLNCCVIIPVSFHYDWCVTSIGVVELKVTIPRLAGDIPTSQLSA